MHRQLGEFTTLEEKSGVDWDKTHKNMQKRTEYANMQYEYTESRGNKYALNLRKSE